MANFIRSLLLLDVLWLYPIVVTQGINVAEISNGIFEYSNDIVKFSLSNARFADGQFYIHGSFSNVPEIAIDGQIPLYETDVTDNQRVESFTHSASSNNPQFIVDLPTSDSSAVSTVIIYPRDSLWTPNFNRYRGMTVAIGDPEDDALQTTCDPLQSLDVDTVRASVATGLKWNCNGATGESIIVNNQHFIMIVEIEAEGMRQQKTNVIGSPTSLEFSYAEVVVFDRNYTSPSFSPSPFSPDSD